MACDPGRAQKVLHWCLVEGRGDEDFVNLHNQAVAGATERNADKLMAACHQMLKSHDEASYHVLEECGAGNSLAWGRQILGLPA
jgi:hypothetical protein